TGDKKGSPVPSRPAPEMDLGKLSSVELVSTLSHPNIWQRRMAQRLLSERGDASIKPALVKVARQGTGRLEARLAAFWTLYSADLLDDATLDILATDPAAEIRTWVARFTGERRDASEQAIQRLKKLGRDSSPSVRLAVATAVRQFTSGSLTIDTPVSD